MDKEIIKKNGLGLELVAGRTFTSATYIAQMWFLACVDHFVTVDIPRSSKAGNIDEYFIYRHLQGLLGLCNVGKVA